MFLMSRHQYVGNFQKIIMFSEVKNCSNACTPIAIILMLQNNEYIVSMSMFEWCAALPSLLRKAANLELSSFVSLSPMASSGALPILRDVLDE